MLLTLNDKTRNGAVLGCGDCPFQYDTLSDTNMRDGQKCSITDDAETFDRVISDQHDPETMPSWCPLRDGPINVSAEPGSLKKGR